jgi:hypothetical protein
MMQVRHILGVAICFAGLAFAPVVIQFPDAEFYPLIPLLNAAFIRSLMGMVFLVGAWVYRYGISQTALLSFSFLGFGQFLSLIVSSVFLGGNALANMVSIFGVGQPAYAVAFELVLLIAGTASVLLLKIYRVSKVSVSLGTLWLGLLAFYVVYFPHGYMVAEVNIPQQFFPQFMEFATVLASFLFAYSFFRPFRRTP